MKEKTGSIKFVSVSDLKTDLTSALWRMSKNFALEIKLLKLCVINSEKTLRFALIIFTRISFYWITLDAWSESISLSTSSTSTAEKIGNAFYGFPLFLLYLDDFEIPW